MALKDLIASKAALAEEVIEEIVSEFARYDPDHKTIILTPKAHDLPSKAKVLIYLVALQGWPFVVDEPVPTDSKPGEIEQYTGIMGGTLRPILKELKDRSVIIERGGRYFVRDVGLGAIKAELDGRSSAEHQIKSWRRARVTPAKERGSEKETMRRTRRSAEAGIQEQFDALFEEGFFDKPKTLADVQRQFHKHAIIVPQSSIPPYLLKAIRSGRLERDKDDVNGRRVWVYTKKHK